MTDEQGAVNHYSPEMVDMALNIWMRSSVSVLDIRYRKIERCKPLDNYLLPSSMFIYTAGAPASIRLNQQPYQTGSYGLCHAGKGTRLSIAPLEDDLEAFMILYRAEEIPFYKRGLRRLMEKMNPYTQLYGFTPTNPIYFTEKCRRMLEAWHTKDNLEQFHTRILLYQLIHHVYVELQRGDVCYMEPDYVEWVKAYLDSHYMEPISIQAISERLPLSRTVLGRLFRKRENSSLQEYLNKRRLEVAKSYLVHSTMRVQEVALGSGFLDEINLNRMFKKYMQLTPGEYRRKSRVNSTKNVIDNNYHSLYNEDGLDELVKSDRDGEYAMFGKARSRQMILAAAISVMMLLSACGSAATDQRGGTSAAPPTSATQTSGDVEKKIIKAANGEIEVPIKPERMAVSGFAYGDIIPFGLTDRTILLEGWVDLANKSEAWLAAWGDYTENVARFESFDDLEGMMTLEPDIIIGTTGQLSEDSERALQKITATILYEQENIDRVHYTMGDRMTFLGELFGMPDKAAQLIEQFNDKSAAAIQALEDKGLADKKIVFVHGLENGTPIIATDINQSLTYKILGMPAPAKVEQELLFGDNLPDDLFSNHVKVLSVEVLPDYIKDADIIIYRNVGEQEEDLIAKLAEIEVWANISAVSQGNVLYVPFTDPLFGFSYADYIVSLDSFVDRLAELPLAQD